MYTKIYTDGTKESENRHFRINDDLLAEALWHYVPTKTRKQIIKVICDCDEDAMLKRLDISAGKMIEILRASGKDAIKDPVSAILRYNPEYSSFKKWDCPALREHLSYFVRISMRAATNDMTDNYEGLLTFGDADPNEIDN